MNIEVGNVNQIFPVLEVIVSLDRRLNIVVTYYLLEVATRLDNHFSR